MVTVKNEQKPVPFKSHITKVLSTSLDVVEIKISNGDKQSDILAQLDAIGGIIYGLAVDVAAQGAEEYKEYYALTVRYRSLIESYCGAYPPDEFVNRMEALQTLARDSKDIAPPSKFSDAFAALYLGYFSCLFPTCPLFETEVASTLLIGSSVICLGLIVLYRKLKFI